MERSDRQGALLRSRCGPVRCPDVTRRPAPHPAHQPAGLSTEEKDHRICAAYHAAYQSALRYMVSMVERIGDRAVSSTAIDTECTISSYVTRLFHRMDVLSVYCPTDYL